MIDQFLSMPRRKFLEKNNGKPPKDFHRGSYEKSQKRKSRMNKDLCTWYTPELRRSSTDLLTTFKIINKLYDLPSSSFFTHTIRQARKQPNSLYMPHLPKLKKAQNFFSYRILNRWNNLSKLVGKLDLHDIKDPDIFAKYLDALRVNSIVPNPLFEYSRP
jgi:hypothetical protein